MRLLPPPRDLSFGSSVVRDDCTSAKARHNPLRQTPSVMTCIPFFYLYRLFSFWPLHLFFLPLYIHIYIYLSPLYHILLFAAALVLFHVVIDLCILSVLNDWFVELEQRFHQTYPFNLQRQCMNRREKDDTALH